MTQRVRRGPTPGHRQAEPEQRKVTGHETAVWRSVSVSGTDARCPDRSRPRVGDARRFLDEAVEGGATLVLTGEPGVGKTALLAAAAERAASAGVRVVRGGGVEYETDVSFAGLHQLVDLLSDDLGRLPRSSRAAIEVALGIGSGPAPDRLAVLTASLALLREAASTGPLLVVIDDLHWLDRASGAVVGFVGRRLRGSRIGMLGAIRPGVGGFFERAGLPEFDVAPLVDADAMELLARRFVHLPIRLRRDVVAEAQGNPLALLEFAASAGGADAGAQASREVRGLYAARIERMPEATRRVLLVAVLDGSGGLGVLARGGWTRRPRACRARSSGGHRRAQRRADVPASDDQVGGGRAVDPRATACRAPAVGRAVRRPSGTARPSPRGSGVRAGRGGRVRGRSRCPSDPATRRRRGSDLPAAAGGRSQPEPQDRSRRLADAAYVGAHTAGRLADASELLRDAQRRDRSLGETLHAAVATAYLLLNSDGNAQTTHQLLTVAIESALGEPDPDRDGLAEALYTLVLVCHYAGRDEYWAPFHEAMRRLGETSPADVRLLAEIFADPASASDWALAELDRADRTAEGHRRRRADHPHRARRVLRRSPARLPGGADSGSSSNRLQSGAVGMAMMAMSMLSFDELHAGRWDEAQRSRTEASALCDERGYRLVRLERSLRAGARRRQSRGSRGVSGHLRRDDRVGRAAPAGPAGRLGEPRARPRRPRRGRLRGVLRPCLRHQPGRDAAGPTTRRRCGPRGTWWTRRCTPAASMRPGLTPTRCDEADIGRLSPRAALLMLATGAMVAPDDAAPDAVRAGARTAGDRGVAVRPRACAARVRRTPAAPAPDP